MGNLSGMEVAGTWGKLVAALALATALAGCGAGLESIPETHYFIIDYTLPHKKPKAAPLPASVGVDDFRADAVYRSEKIVFRKVPYRVDFYPYERWGARPDEMVTDRFIDHLLASGRFRDVVRASTGTSSDFLVRGRVKRFEEVDGPGDTYSASAKIEVSVIDRRSGDVIYQHSLSSVTRAKTKPVQGFVDAMADNIRGLLSQATRQIASAIEKRLRERSGGS